MGNAESRGSSSSASSLSEADHRERRSASVGGGIIRRRSRSRSQSQSRSSASSSVNTNANVNGAIGATGNGTDTTTAIGTAAATAIGPGTDQDPNTSSNSNSVVSSSGVSVALESGGIERGQQATEEATSQLGYWYLLKNGYNEMVNLIIRPPRAIYEVSELGPTNFCFAGRDYDRVDFVVQNARKQSLQCSHWRPVGDVNGVTAFPCVIYLHGNSSCRLEALSILRSCLSMGITVVALDCAGSGLSEGEYISLGYYEREDVQAVVDHLRKSNKVTTIALWGRSMGAATALLFADRDPSIAALVVDSAFTDLEALVMEIVAKGREEGYTIPLFVVKLVMKCIRSSVLKRANFDLKQLSPIAHTDRSFIPALFVAANGDDFIAPHHSEQLHAKYAGDKNIVKVTGDHNSMRPSFFLDSAGIFLQAAMQVDPRLVPDGPIARGRTPWTSSSSRTDMEIARALRASLALDCDDLPTTEWTCRSCTFINAATKIRCEMCRAPFSRRNSASREADTPNDKDKDQSNDNQANSPRQKTSSPRRCTSPRRKSSSGRLQGFSKDTVPEK